MGDEAELRLVLLVFSLAHLAVLTAYVRRAGPGTFVPLARQSEPVVSLLVVASCTCYAAGVALITANWFIGACAAAFCAGLAYRSRGEEANLVAAFGEDYRRYRRRVPAFIPRPHTR